MHELILVCMVVRKATIKQAEENKDLSEEWIPFIFRYF